MKPTQNSALKTQHSPLTTEFLLYSTGDGGVKIETLLRDETLWLTQQRMSELFGVGIPAISKHLKNIFESGELEEEVVVSILETTTQHGALKGKTQTKKVKYYNLDVAISVGYRVNSAQATQFRIWATQILSPKGASYASLGQRPFHPHCEAILSPKGASYASLGQRPDFYT